MLHLIALHPVLFTFIALYALGGLWYIASLAHHPRAGCLGLSDFAAAFVLWLPLFMIDWRHLENPRMKLVALSMTVTMFTLVCTSLAMAADAAPATVAPKALASTLMDSVFPFLTALALALASWAAAKLGQKFGIQALTEKNNFIEKLAFQGITLAEEKAAQAIAARESLTGKDKLDIAISHVLAAAPKVTADQASAVIHSVLAQIPGVGASKTTALATAGQKGFTRVGLLLTITAAGLLMILAGCSTCYTISQSGDGRHYVRTDAKQATELDGTAVVPFNGGSASVPAAAK